MRICLFYVMLGLALAMKLEGQVSSVTCNYSEYISDYTLPDDVQAVVLVGDVGYIIYGKYANGFLRVVDVTDRRNIVTRAEIELPYTPGSAKYVGGILYCYGGLYIDVSDPANPFVAGQINSHFGVFDSEVIDGIAYLAANLTGLQIVDIRDPKNHIELGVVPMPERAVAIEVVGQYAYVAANFDDLYVVDVSDPESPFVTDNVNFWGEARSVAVVGDYAFVGAGTGGLVVVDVSDPYDLEVVALYDNTDRFGGSISGLRVDGDRLYCADDVRGVFEIDISDPLHPARVNVIQLPMRASGLSMSDQLFVAACQGYDTIYLFERDRLPPSPVVGNVQAMYEGCHSAALGQRVFLSDCRTDIYVVDASDREQPRIEATIPMPLPIRGMTASENRLFVLMQDFGVVSLDISDVTSPEIVDILRIEGQLRGMAVEGDVACILTDTDSCWFVDLEDVSGPRIVGRYTLGDGIHGVRLSEGRAYLSSYNIHDEGRIDIADVTNPHHVVTLGSFEIPGPGYLLAVHEGLVFVQYSLRGTWHISIYDATDPASVRLVSAYQPIEALSDPVIINEILYATGWANGIHAYSLADLNKLSLEGYFVTGESMGPVQKLDDDTLAVFGKTNGLMTVNVSDTCSTCLPDTNNDGTLTPADFSAWVAAFNSGAPACDQNSDGSCTPADFSAWVANYNAGCQ